MKKQIIAGMLLLVLTVSGCSAISTAPTTINELAEETRAEAETDSTDSILSSESKETDAPVESKAPEETEKPESTAAPETAASQPIAEEAPKAPKPAASVSSESKECATPPTTATGLSRTRLPTMGILRRTAPTAQKGRVPTASLRTR